MAWRRLSTGIYCFAALGMSLPRERCNAHTIEGTPSVSSLVFTAANWFTAQTVTISVTDDLINDGDLAYSIRLAASSADAVYNSLAASLVDLTNTHDDVAGNTVTPTGGLTTEAGGTAQFTVVLHTEPVSDVTVSVTTLDSGEGSPSGH